MTRSRGLRIVVAGTVATVPGQGGWTWVLLQYVLGLRRLGHHVLLVDPLAPAALMPAGESLAHSVNAAYFSKVVRDFDVADTSALLLTGGGRQTVGMSYEEIERAIRRADALINVSGALRDETLLSLARRRIYLDLDPAFTQLWHAVEGIDMGLADHTDFVTIGCRINAPDCHIPTCGVSWLTMVPPVVLACWPVARDHAPDALTTVAHWRGYGSIEHDGVRFGQKAHAWRALAALPTMTRDRFVVALAIDPGETADLAMLAANRWELIPPAQVAHSPAQYRAFVQASKGELGIAKTGYILSRCGWFSDRSACYLASGRPVLAQETGFSGVVPTGDGLLTFTTVDEAVNALERMNANYAHHAQAARALAEDYFDSDKVLTRLLEQLALTP